MTGVREHRSAEPLVDAHTIPERQLRAAVRAGRLVRILPGWYAPPDPPLFIRCLALARHDSRAVLLGRAAAALTWWPDLSVDQILASRPHRPAPTPGFTWTKRLPGRNVQMLGEIRLTDPATTVLHLIDDLGGTAIDESLRRRATTLAALHDALDAMPHRQGNDQRRRLLIDSRDEPWSPAERTFHRILRRARLPEPFRTNYRVTQGGRVGYLDAALPRLKLGFEVDGRAFHSTASAFEADHERELWLADAGWRLHRFTAVMVFDRPDWVRAKLESLARARQRDQGR